MKKRISTGKIALIAIIILLLAAGAAALTAVVISEYGMPGDMSVEKNGTVRGSILSDVPSEAGVEDPEMEPVEKIDPEIESSITSAGVEDFRTEGEDEEEKEVDLIVFAGQSNMSGWGGNAGEAPQITEGAGAEYRAVSDPYELVTITEPFGIFENTEVMNDMYLKRGTLVTAFVNEWYKETGVPVVAVSASKGGTPSTYWASDAVCDEVVSRYHNAKDYLTNEGYRVRNQFLVFLQGENDVLENISDEQYLTDINVFSSRMFIAGIDKFFMIRIGGIKGDHDAFKRIADLQTELCRTDPRFVLVSTLLSGVGDDHMTDKYHYDQAALNLLGAESGRNGAYFAKTRQDPEIKDYLTGETFVPVNYEGQ